MSEETDPDVSSRRRLANQRNARKSTGPRTRAGKTRASRNALRHGLNAAIVDDPTVSDGIWRAAAFLQQQLRSGTAEAGALAEACAQLARVRRAKLACLEAALEKSGRTSANMSDRAEATSVDRIHAEALLEAAEELLKLDQYERKARSRQRRLLENPGIW